MQEAEKIIHEIEKAIIKIRNSQYGISLEDGKKLDIDKDYFRFNYFHNQELIISGMKDAIMIIKKLNLKKNKL